MNQSAPSLLPKKTTICRILLSVLRLGIRVRKDPDLDPSGVGFVSRPDLLYYPFWFSMGSCYPASLRKPWSACTILTMAGLLHSCFKGGDIYNDAGREQPTKSS